MNNPKYVKIDDQLFEINTDFRVALECDNIARNTNIGDYERALAIVYKLFGEKGLDFYNQNKLVELGMKYISLGKEQKSVKNDFDNKYELDLNKCQGLISSSFKYDYKYDPFQLEYLHWYDFYNDLENLSTSELGHCCILNRIVALLNYDVSQIKDVKERTKINEAKEEFRKKYCICKDEQTEAQKESAKEYYKSIGIDIERRQ